MFTLIGIGAGAAWIFSVIWNVYFPDFFPPIQFKNRIGCRTCIFEAATVILTLVLLGSLLEKQGLTAKPNSAVKELLKLAPNKAIVVKRWVEVEVSIDEIKLR